MSTPPTAALAANISSEELRLVALVARYHRRAEPKDEHFLYGVLDEANRERVRRLASLLRLADALDREHLQRVESVECAKTKGAIMVQVVGRGDLLLEQWALRKKAQMFEGVYGRRVEVRLSDPALAARII